MNLILHILFALKLLKLSVENVQKWAKQRNVSKLIFALKKGKYKVRKAAALQLGSLRNQAAIPVLIKATKDEARPVAEASIKALQHFSRNKKVKQVLEEAVTFWMLKDKRVENKAAFFENSKGVYNDSKKLFDKTKLKTLTEIKTTLARRMPRIGRT